MSRVLKMRPPVERREDAYIRKLYRHAGCKVVSFSQPRNTMQTPGWPDLLVFDYRSGSWWAHEVKRQRGEKWVRVDSKQSDEQVEMQRLLEAFGIEYLCGARDVAEKKLRELGRIV